MCIRDRVSDAVNGYSEYIDKLAYQPGTTALEHRWKKCIELNIVYVEK